MFLKIIESDTNIIDDAPIKTCHVCIQRGRKVDSPVLLDFRARDIKRKPLKNHEYKDRLNLHLVPFLTYRRCFLFTRNLFIYKRNATVKYKRIIHA